MDFVDGIPPLRVDGDASEKVIRIRSSGVQHIVVADQEMGLFLGKLTALIVDAVHAEEDGLSHVFGRTQFGEQILHIFLVGFDEDCPATIRASTAETERADS